jgi:hypothetical protein
MGQIRCPETSVINYHTTSRNIRGQRRSHQYRGGSLKSREGILNCILKKNLCKRVGVFQLVKNRWPKMLRNVRVLDDEGKFLARWEAITWLRKTRFHDGNFFFCDGPRSLEAYCATLWWRRLVFFLFSCNGAPVEWNWQSKTEVLGGEKNLSQCHSVHHKSHMDWPGIETGPPRWEAADYPPEPWHGPRRQFISSHEDRH